MLPHLYFGDVDAGPLLQISVLLLLLLLLLLNDRVDGAARRAHPAGRGRVVDLVRSLVELDPVGLLGGGGGTAAAAANG